MLLEASPIFPLAVFFFLMPQTESARILAAFPHTGKSHYFMFKPLVYKLAELGHQVHVITYFPDEIPPPNISFIDLQSNDTILAFNTFSLEMFETSSFIHKFKTVAEMFQALVILNGARKFATESCTNGLGHPNLQKMLKEDLNFDLLIVEFFSTDCFASLAHFYNVPLVGIFSATFMPYHNDRFGNPDNPAYIPNHFLPYSSRMNFRQRLVNTYLTYISKVFYRFFYDSPADAAVKQYVGDNIPPVREIVKNTSLFLLNTHFSVHQPRPLVPSIVELGGFHVSPPGKIPAADVLRFIEESKSDVIFFSLGSTVRGSTLPKYKLRMIQNVFSKVPYRILWKWEEDEMPGKPSNVMIGKWFPQNEILSHPKVKLFVTHSGLMGTEEAIYNGVPMLMMPLFGDQPMNAAACEEKGVGVAVNYYTLTEHTFAEALTEALQDRYAENAKRLAEIFRDRPVSSMDSAIYWTEYVIRHKGASHLRSAAIDLPWYQEYLLDVVAATCISLYICCKSSIFLLKLCFCQRKFNVLAAERSKKKD